MKLEKIIPERCLGDIEHNKTIDLLFDGIDRREVNCKVMLDRLIRALADHPHTWILNVIHKDDARRLNAIMKAKTTKTFKKRLEAYEDKLKHGTHYGMLFNKELIQVVSMGAM